MMLVNQNVSMHLSTLVMFVVITTLGLALLQTVVDGEIIEFNVLR